MDDNGGPKAMDSSWYICQHYCVSTRPDPTHDVDHSCAFLPEACLTDLNASQRKPYRDLGQVRRQHTLFRSTRFPLQNTQSTELKSDEFLGWDHSWLEKPESAKTLVVDQVGQSSWMVGTGFGDSGNTTTYYAASNRTYLVATVFGYSSAVHESKRQVPYASLACLCPGWAPLPNSDPWDNGTVPSSTACSSSIAHHFMCQGSNIIITYAHIFEIHKANKSTSLIRSAHGRCPRTCKIHTQETFENQQSQGFIPRIQKPGALTA
ncbi:hypothetical protein LA080_007166 [Diaporthe eres]|nr:hypothetical protein LA080_007166 [Diaporthe eres]